MRTLQTPEVPCWLTHSDKPTRKLAHTLCLLGLPGGGKALVDTMLPNHVIAEGITAERIPDSPAQQAAFETAFRENVTDKS